MNKIMVMGRLVKDPDVKLTPSGVAVAKFTLAVNRRFVNKETGQKEVDFLDVVLFGKVAEVVGNYVTKGQRLIVEGRLQTRTYNAKDGSNRKVVEIVGENVDLVEKKTNEGEKSPNSMSSFGREVAKKAGTFDEEIPF